MDDLLRIYHPRDIYESMRDSVESEEEVLLNMFGEVAWSNHSHQDAITHIEVFIKALEKAKSTLII